MKIEFLFRDIFIMYNYMKILSDVTIFYTKNNFYLEIIFYVVYFK